MARAGEELGVQRALDGREPAGIAMVALGYMIGARPSSLRPIRHRGKSPDYNAKTGVLVLRRSHTIGEEVMESTKNGDRGATLVRAARRGVET